MSSRTPRYRINCRALLLSVVVFSWLCAVGPSADAQVSQGSSRPDKNVDASVQSPVKPATQSPVQPAGLSPVQSSVESPAQPLVQSTNAAEPTASVPTIIHRTEAPRLAPGEEPVALTIGGEEILVFKATISGFTPAQRVSIIKDRVRKLIERRDFDPTKISMIDTGFSTDIVCGDSIILTVTDIDANQLGFKDRNTLAADCASKLTRTLTAEKLAHSPKVIFIAMASTAIATAILIIMLLFLAAVFPRIYSQIAVLRGRYIRSVKIQKAELLSEESLSEVVIGICRVARGLMTLVLILVYIERVLSFFPTTRYFSTKIVDETVLPVVTVVGASIASYFPNLLIIALISASTYYLIAFTHFIFQEIARGKITVPDFDPEWADPTYKIARFLVIAFSLVLIFPYLPGSGSPAFQQISIFLGVLISLGSSGAVSNIVAGVFLTYTGAFRIGDRVKISDTTGDVVERKLLYTRIRSIKDEYITVPNSMVLGAHIINYSSSTRHNGLILHTAVTIGYDTPWQKVQELLIASALATEGVLHEPSPFVLITALNDFYVTHEINCYTASPHLMAVIYANIHKSILTEFARAGVEIMSPQYTALRRGERKALPPDASK